ncbi:MAG: tryptophan 7-halogenase [Bryobacterales bacterium]|nr:tryptophan 7-halogenase [Bryobacterales bacterium]
MNERETYDLIVIGGGPAGSTLATLVAKRGHRVLLIEKELFPRHQIGESLLPSTVHGICTLLGVKEELEAAGFPKKLGGTFRWGKNPEPWTFRFSTAATLGAEENYAYQVERSRFDQMLLTNAARCGVEVLQGCAAKCVLQEEGRFRGVEFEHPSRGTLRAYSTFVADASGNTSLHSRLAGAREYSQFFQNVALYAYFENGKRLPTPNQGNILCAAFEEGWFWYIPLSATLTSVGAVVAREHAQRLRENPEAAMDHWIGCCPLIRDYLSNARRVDQGQYGKFRIRKDYSYCNTRFWQQGLVLVGDSACFVDPVFSSGVHLATYSAMLAARSINTVLSGALPEEICFREFERRYRREFSNFYQFLVAFYDANQDEESYFWKARTVLRTEERNNEAFVRLVAGVSSNDRSLSSGANGYFDSRLGLGSIFAPVTCPDLPAEHGAQAQAAEFLSQYGVEMQVMQQGARTGSHDLDQGLFADGLRSSADGLSWQAAQVCAA